MFKRILNFFQTDPEIEFDDLEEVEYGEELDGRFGEEVVYEDGYNDFI
ncbi:hypothetical protein SAMN05421676_1121 [Salinibacillus kushneri]|uniref:Uncharacterized protein n=1 Tax=Salinibacillus kushneri TaxID=237682 RepID=A0A1I0B745_9BACI|nr:hypothetical protein [Salinibacillus kushneri]SET02696.1 hypothetical protein SAMN05421676_102370 [Salinibacillus kushneri]SET94550.1 hypothetical protein SAMN05421676_1121 [Salinibacillus kushneri]